MTTNSSFPPLPEEQEKQKNQKQMMPPLAPPIYDPGKEKNPKPASKLWILTKALLNNQRALRSSRSSLGKRIGIILLYAFVLVSLSPLLIMIGMNLWTMFNIGLGQPTLTMYFIAQCLLSLFTIVLAFPSIFYFSTDNKTLLSLPLDAFDIVGAKTVLVLGTQAITMIGTGLPVLIGYGLSSAFSWLGFLFLVIAELVIHLTLFAITGTLCLALFSLLPKVLNKDRFTLITSGLALVLSVTIGMSVQRLGNIETFDPSTLTGLLATLENSFGFLTYLFFQVPFAAKSVMSLSLWDFLVEIGIFVLSIVVYMWAAKKWYFSSAMAADWASSSKKKLEKSQIRSLPAWQAYLKSEVTILVKTPAYLFNVALSGFILPIVLSVALFMQRKELEVALDPELISQIFESSGLSAWAIALSAGFFCALFLAGVSGTSSTAISRMGLSGVAWMKTIPMSIGQQALLKCIPGIVLSILAIQLLVIPLHIFLHYPLWMDLFFLLGNALGSLFNNFLGIIIDLLHPKLVWESETQAVKSNFNAVIDLGISTLFLLILVAIYFLTPFNMATFIVLGLSAALSIALAWIIFKNAPKWLLRDR